MTIGKFGHDYSTGPNPDFISLMKCHKDVCEAFSLSEADVEVSMGMSDDFEEAVSVLISVTMSFKLLNRISCFRSKWAAQSFELVVPYLDIDRKRRIEVEIEICFLLL